MGNLSLYDYNDPIVIEYQKQLDIQSKQDYFLAKEVNLFNNAKYIIDFSNNKIYGDLGTPKKVDKMLLYGDLNWNDVDVLANCLAPIYMLGRADTDNEEVIKLDDVLNDFAKNAVEFAIEKRAEFLQIHYPKNIIAGREAAQISSSFMGEDCSYVYALENYPDYYDVEIEKKEVIEEIKGYTSIEKLAYAELKIIEMQNMYKNFAELDAPFALKLYPTIDNFLTETNLDVETDDMLEVITNTLVGHRAGVPGEDLYYDAAKIFVIDNQLFIENIKIKDQPVIVKALIPIEPLLNDEVKCDIIMTTHIPFMFQDKEIKTVEVQVEEDEFGILILKNDFYIDEHIDLKLDSGYNFDGWPLESIRVYADLQVGELVHDEIYASVFFRHPDLEHEICFDQENDAEFIYCNEEEPIYYSLEDLINAEVPKLTEDNTR